MKKKVNKKVKFFCIKKQFESLRHHCEVLDHHQIQCVKITSKNDIFKVVSTGDGFCCTFNCGQHKESLQLVFDLLNWIMTFGKMFFFIEVQFIIWNNGKLLVLSCRKAISDEEGVEMRSDVCNEEAADSPISIWG